MSTTTRPMVKTMSFALWTLACESRPKTESLPENLGQARMHPQSKGGSVLRLRSRRALSPAPPQQLEPAALPCQLKTCMSNT
jgi:hypothetical protein